MLEEQKAGKGGNIVPHTRQTARMAPPSGGVVGGLDDQDPSPDLKIRLGKQEGILIQLLIELVNMKIG